VGYDANTQELKPLTDKEAADRARLGLPVFRVGEEITLRGITFIVADVAPGQLKLKPKKDG